MRSNASQVDMMTIQLSTSISATHDRYMCVYIHTYINIVSNVCGKRKLAILESAQMKSSDFKISIRWQEMNHWNEIVLDSDTVCSLTSHLDCRSWFLHLSGE